jgi:hypothetical protein
MLLVIFGAGASYDSIASLTNIGNAVGRPPLARHLFTATYDGYVERHPVAGPLIAHLRELPDGTNLEAELDRIQTEEVPRSFTRRRQVIALRYYLRDVLTVAAKFEKEAPAQTNYHRLVDRLMRWQEGTGAPIALVSFNYDTMLERAVSVVAGIPFPDLASYVANEKLRLFKPHGSVNWGRVIANDVSITKNRSPEDTEAAVLDLAGKSGLELTNEYSVAETSSNPTVGGRTLLPALTVPIQQKLDFECPPAHIDLLRQSLRELKWVLSIGWRAGEQNFLKLWRESEPYTQPRLISGNGRAESGEAVVNSLKVAGLRFSETNVTGSFTQLLKDDTLKHLLERPFRGLGIEP